MKLAAPLLACFVTAPALAQSSLAVFGIVDLGMRYVRNDGSGHRTTMQQGGLNPSRLGFRGTEDLGGGYALKFWLEGALVPTSGAAGSTGALDFTRESHMTLATPYGDLRLGRDYSATFWNTTWPFEPFGNNGIGGSVGVARFNGGSNLAGGAALQQPSTLRVSNAVSYFLPPSLGGVYGQVQYAFPENVPNGKYTGARIGYAKGPLNVAASVARQSLAGTSEKFRIFNVGGSYDFGAVRVIGQYNRDELPVPIPMKETRFLLGAVVPAGPGEIHASVVRSDLANSSDDATLVALGYVYNLSKRSAIYGTYAHVSNKGAARFSVSGGTTPGGNGNSSPGGPTAGGKSTGLEFGIRHFF
jgi:predicted porin